MTIILELIIYIISSSTFAASLSKGQLLADHMSSILEASQNSLCELKCDTELRILEKVNLFVPHVVLCLSPEGDTLVAASQM